MMWRCFKIKSSRTNGSGEKVYKVEFIRLDKCIECQDHQFCPLKKIDHQVQHLGRVLKHNFGPGGWNLNGSIFKSLNAWGFPVGDVEASN